MTVSQSHINQFLRMSNETPCIRSSRIQKKTQNKEEQKDTDSKAKQLSQCKT